MKRTKAKQAEMTEAQEYLRTFLKPGCTVYTTCKSVSRSGMSRKISCHVIRKDATEQDYIHDITGWVAKATDTPIDRDVFALKIGGCGMDMGFHVVYTLSRYLFPAGFVPAEAGRNGRNGSDKNTVDPDGGYALNQRWL